MGGSILPVRRWLKRPQNKNDALVLWTGCHHATALLRHVGKHLHLLRVDRHSFDPRAVKDRAIECPPRVVHNPAGIGQPDAGMCQHVTVGTAGELTDGHWQGVGLGCACGKLLAGRSISLYHSGDAIFCVCEKSARTFEQCRRESPLIADHPAEQTLEHQSHSHSRGHRPPTGRCADCIRLPLAGRGNALARLFF